MKRTIGSLGLIVCVLVIGASLGRTGEKENPILESAKKVLADPTKPFSMVVYLTVKEDQGKNLEAAFKPAIVASRKEKGCLAYDLNRDLKETHKYYVYERWQSLKALEFHMETEHFKTLVGKVGDLLAGPPEAKFFAITGE